MYRIVIILFLCCSSLDAAYLFKNGTLLNTKYLASMSAEAHYQQALSQLDQHQWQEAIDTARIIMVSFPTSPFAREAHYVLAVALYEQGELDIANKEFSSYLTIDNSSAHFEDAYRYKLAIAQKFAHNHRRHLFGIEALPKVMTGRSLAISIFDEITTALPHLEITAIALVEKARLLSSREEWASAITTYETVIRRFPATDYAKRAYTAISSCYIELLRHEPQNTDAVALARINSMEFHKEFPQAEEKRIIEQQWLDIQTIHANALYETALLYERKGSREAAIVYHTMIVQQFPSIPVAQKSQQRLQEISS